MIPDLYNRKLGFGELGKASWNVFCRNFIYLFLFCLISGCILKALDYVAFISLPASDDKYLAAQMRSLISMFFGFIVPVAVIAVTKRDASGQQVCWSGIFRSVREFFPAAFLINVMSELINSLMWMPKVLVRFNDLESSALMSILTILLFFLAIMLMVYFAFAFQSLVLRRQYGVSAFIYSFNIVKGRWWNVFGAVMLMGLALAVPLVIILFFLRMNSHVALQNGMYFIAPLTMVFGAYMSTFMTIFFLNLDREKDVSNSAVLSENNEMAS